MKRIAIAALTLLSSIMTADQPKDDKHCFVPIVKYRDFKYGDSRSQSFLIGAGYHYVQLEGYNVKVESALINPQSKTHHSFSFDNMYKFPVSETTRLFPIAGVSCDVYGLETTSAFEKKHYTTKTRIAGGVGAERSINGKFQLGFNALLFRDIANLETKETADTFAGVKDNHDNGYFVKGSIDFKMDEKIFLRLEPFYRGTFKDTYTEKGATFSMICNF